MINNAINFSPFFNYQKIASTTKLYKAIFIWYFIILSFEFIYGSIYFDQKTAINQVLASVLREGFILFIVARAILPRYRYDQLMKLGWKILMPISVLFVYLISFILLNLYIILYRYNLGIT